MPITRTTYLLLFLLFSVGINAQNATNRFNALEQQLEEYAMDHPQIDTPIDISITGTLQEFAIAFSKETKLNLTIDPSINPKVVTNFASARSRDILLHLCKFYNLDLTFSGTIISIIPHEEAPEQPAPRSIDITYNDYNNKLSLNLKKDTLDFVVGKISQLTKKNVIATSAASSIMVSGYVGATLFEEALDLMAKRNDLAVSKNDKGYYVIDVANPKNAKKEEETTGSKKTNRRTGKKDKSTKGKARGNTDNLNISAKPDTSGIQLLDIDATDVLLTDIIQTASDKTGNNYFMMASPTEKVNLRLKGVSYDQLLTSLLKGTTYSFKEESDIYLIGDQTAQGLKESKVVQLQHRTVKELATFIPADIAEGVQIQEFVQLNSLILSGTASQIQQVENFIKDIDRSVPVVMIELLIVDVKYNKDLRAGFQAGLATEPVKSQGEIYPGIDFTFSSGAINELLSSLAGNGIINLGQVAPNFYATLQAVEDNGYAKIRSKPRLSTLNGVEATLSLGETRYYLNERTTLQGNQNPISLQDRRYEPVNADFSIRIVPIVSGDEYVTLEIDVNQSDFIGQIQTNAPPPQVSRTFTSNIRILNREMIVLGGLESKSVEDSGRGVPFLSRIPIIKWLFSSRRKNKNKSKLLVFVKPTVIY